MEENKSYIDFHIHTNKSDGMFCPYEIVNLANQNSTNFISICDHDEISGFIELQSALLKGMKCVNGVEFSSYIDIDDKQPNIHILGYCFNSESRVLLNILEELKQKRISAHKQTLKLLKDVLLTFPDESISSLDLERYCWFDREIIKCFESENYDVETILQLKTHFQKNRFSYGIDYAIDSRTVIDAIKSSGGFALLAHPMAYKLSREDISKMIRKLVEIGIDGIEIYQSDCSIMDTKFLHKQVNQYNLRYSVGSDFHKINSSDGRVIGRGINDNLCVEETSLANKILEKKLYLEGVK